MEARKGNGRGRLILPKPNQLPAMRRLTADANGVIHYPDGREVCDRSKARGRTEYVNRKQKMLERQGFICALRISVNCPTRLSLETATFEHQDGRGMGGANRDDRIERLNHDTGVMEPYNAAVCVWCNYDKGSKRQSYT